MTRFTIPLPDATLCVDCDAIWNAREGSVCPRCGSRAGWFIARSIQPIRPREHEVETTPQQGEVESFQHAEALLAAERARRRP